VFAHQLRNRGEGSVEVHDRISLSPNNNVL
jgi:hypothetical protein